MPRALFFNLVLISFAVASPAGAQSFNPDGTQSMIPPDGNIFDDNRAPGTGAIGVSHAPMGGLANPVAPGASQERFDIDCDPDIQPCVDPDSESAYDDGYDPNAYQQFESTLAPYGEWSDDPNYGEVWTPSADQVGPDFEPYATDGQWMASSDYGFSWVSDYDWGWAPFHYGRWILLDGMGWAWVPGTQWGPAWVDWRYGNGYCGWSPLPPRGIVVPAPAGRPSGRHPLWHFALATDLTRRNPNYVPLSVLPTVYVRTAPVRNLRTVVVNGVSTRITLGPSVATVSRDIGRAVPAFALKNGAPSVLPRAGIVAHPGVALSQRAYVTHQPMTSNARGPSNGPRPLVQGRGPANTAAPHVGAPPSYPLGRTSSVPSGQPAYRYPGNVRSTAPVQRSFSSSNYAPPQRSYSQQPVYTGPTQQPVYQPRETYVPQPTYVAPQRSYETPQRSYEAPRTYVQQPSYVAPAPAYSQPATVHPSLPAPAPAPHPSVGGSVSHHR